MHEGRVRPGPGPDRQDLAARQRGPLLAAGPDGRALAEDPGLDGIAGACRTPARAAGRRWRRSDGGSLPVFTMALQTRFRSREEAPFGDRCSPRSATSSAGTR